MMFQLAAVAGPSLAGLVIAGWSIGWVYVINAISFLTVIGALIGAALGLIGGVIGSLLGPKPTPAEQAYFEELRDPSGDALYDRAQRRAAAAASQ
jgi:hypothetical protein